MVGVCGLVKVLCGVGCGWPYLFFFLEVISLILHAVETPTAQIVGLIPFFFKKNKIKKIKKI